MRLKITIESPFKIGSQAIFKSCIFFSSVFISPYLVRAEDSVALPVPPQYIIPSAEFTPPFEPVDAFVLYRNSPAGPLYRVPAFFEGSSSKIVGAPIKAPPNLSTLSYSVLLVGRNGEMQSSPFMSSSIDAFILDPLAVDLEREELLKKKQALQSIEVQIKAQDESLRRLRADAEVVANLGEIVQIKEEAARAQRDTASLERDIRNIEALIARAKSLPQPQNFSKREIQLTQEVSELAALASGAETGELERRAASEGQLQDRMLLLEQSRFEDIDQLQRTYDELLREARARGVTVLDSPTPSASTN